MRSDSPFWRAVEDTNATALASGALRPIETKSTILEDGGVRFVARVGSNLAHKDEDGAARSSDFDPFLEPEPALIVTDVSDSHVAVLNKYNVLEHHVILVTRVFEEQESLLTVADFDAGLRCLREDDGLLFYNAGPLAGASQRHKHLQLVPVPIGDGPERLPIEPVLDDDSRGLPFVHSVCRIDDDPERTHARYLRLLASIGDARAYNLLATCDWMLVVPRARASWASLSVNAIGFAGAMLVRSDDELAALRRLGPMRLLREVTRSG